LSTPSDRFAARATGIRKPRATVPGLALDEVWLAPDCTVVAALRGPDSTGTGALLFLDSTTGAQEGEVTLGPDELAVLSAGWSIGATHNWRHGEVQLWRPGNGEPLGALSPHRGRAVQALALSDRGDLAASLGEEGSVALWRPSDRVLLDRFLPMSALDLETCALSFSPDGRMLALRTDADTIELWRTGPLDFHNQLLETGPPALSADGRWVATAGASISLYDLRDRSKPPTILPGRGPLAFTPDGSLLVAGAPDGGTTVWRTAGGQAHAHHRGGHPRALSPDGTILLLTGIGTELVLVDVASGYTVAALTGPRGEVEALAVGPGGRVVAAACSDATLRVWA
jgi:WD40 repeat protein